jgi:hypothetical protein
MMADGSNRSVVVWWPNLRLGIPDAGEWGSLCLWQDRITYIGQHFLAEDGLTIVSREPAGVAEATFHNVISELSREHIVVHIQMPEGMRMEGHLPPVVLEAFLSLSASQHEKWPLVSNDPGFQWQHLSIARTERLSEVLATTAISRLALPQVRPLHVDDLLEARTALIDELLEFRAAILNLTWLLHQQVKDEDDLAKIRREADVLVDTRIKAAVLSLENRMRQHKNKRIRRMLFGTGKVLVDACTLSLSSLGKGLLTLAGEIDKTKPPEDQVATYLYRLKRQLTS